MPTTQFLSWVFPSLSTWMFFILSCLCFSFLNHMPFLVYSPPFLEFILKLFPRKVEWEENIFFYLHIPLKFGLALWMGIIFPWISKDVVPLVFIFHFVFMKSDAIWIPNLAYGIYFSLWQLLESLLYFWSFEISQNMMSFLLSFILLES